MKRKYRWNILIIVLFILFLSALAGLLVTKYVKNILSYSTEIYKYYKTYYIAYGGIELEITKISNHWFGFEDTISKDSATNSNNLKYCYSANCYFESTIKTNSNIIADNKTSYELSACSKDENYTLKQGQWVIIPLFKDLNSWEWTLSYKNLTPISSTDFANISINFYDGNWEKVWLSVVDEDSSVWKSYQTLLTDNDTKINLNDPSFNSFYDENKKSFLVVANTENSLAQQKVCINSKQTKLSSNYINIESNWKFMDRIVSLQAIKQSKLPEYIIYNVINN